MIKDQFWHYLRYFLIFFSINISTSQHLKSHYLSFRKLRFCKSNAVTMSSNLEKVDRQMNGLIEIIRFFIFIFLKEFGIGIKRMNGNKIINKTTVRHKK